MAASAGVAVAGGGDSSGEAAADESAVEGLTASADSAADEVSENDRVIDRAFNPYWGAIFREAAENSRFGQQVEDYACVYTSRVSNFLSYSPLRYFRSPRDHMPHELV